jgi:16S rRNA (cytidine1402-2'-O)-methyltransferase
MNNFLPGLYIVSTPIGNLEDITLRALNVLKNSNKILCEDTRRSLKLLNHYNIKKKLLSHHKFNEKKSTSSIIEFIKKGEVISLISDAGTPILSDPGLVLLKECIKKKIKIFPIPGVSAITTAVSVSGFDEKYFFYGFLPKKEKELIKIAEELKNYDFNIVFFIPALKINFYISFFKKYFFGRKIFIAREMTKIHETFYREKLKDFQGFKNVIKGELTVVLSKNEEQYSLKKSTFNKEKLTLEIAKYLKRYTLKDVVKLISEKNNLPKKQVYDLCLKIKND